VTLKKALAKVLEESTPKSNIYFRGEWKKKNSDELARLEPKYVIVPVYHKIRLTFLDLHDWVLQVSAVADFAMDDFTIAAEWRIALTTVNKLKAEVIDLPLSETKQRKLLFSRLPRFLWRAILYEGDQPRMELLFDATGMQRSFPLLDVYFFQDDFKKQLRKALDKEDIRNELLTRELATFLLKHT
jgi:hypothetical protein